MGEPPGAAAPGRCQHLSAVCPALPQCVHFSVLLAPPALPAPLPVLPPAFPPVLVRSLPLNFELAGLEKHWSAVWPGFLH